MFTFKIVLAVVFLAIQAVSGEKCGYVTPSCVILSDGRIDPNSTIKLTTGLVCDRDHKLYITRDFTACCQPKGSIIVPDPTTTDNPQDTYMLSIVQRLKDVNVYLTDCIHTRDPECTTNAIAKAATVVTDAVKAMGLLTS